MRPRKPAFDGGTEATTLVHSPVDVAYDALGKTVGLALTGTDQLLRDGETAAAQAGLTIITHLIDAMHALKEWGDMGDDAGK